MLWSYLGGGSTDREIAPAPLVTLARAASITPPVPVPTAAAAQVTVATRRVRSKRGRPEPAMPVDVADAGLRRMLDAKHTKFECDEDRAILYVVRRRKGQDLPTEEYPLVEHAEDLAQLLHEAGVTDLLTLAAQHPRYFWNAVRLCDGKLERVEREILEL